MVESRRQYDPSSTRRRVLAMAGALVPLFASASARAQIEPIALTYEAAEQCPSEEEFVSKVRTFASRWSRVPEGTTAVRSIRVRLSSAPAKFIGILTILDARGESFERTIAGPSCGEVTDALTVMVAVAIDPRGAARDQPEAPVSNEVPPAVARETPISRERPRQMSVRSESSSGGVQASFDLRAETMATVVRSALPGIGASMKLEPSSKGGPRWLREWMPAVGLGIRHSFSKERALPGGSVNFRWTAAHVRLCPFRLTLLDAMEVSPCAEANLGRLQVSAEGFVNARAASSPSFDVGGSLWAAVNLSKRLFLSSTVLVAVPLIRQPFALSNGVSLSSSPAVGVLGGIGLGVRM